MTESEMMDFHELDVVPLSDLVREEGEANTIKMLSRFNPVYDSSTGTFLQRDAIQMEKRDLCRTYVFFNGKDDILGFITLGIKCLTISEPNLLSKSSLKTMNVDSSTHVVQSYLLGQISRREGTEGLGSTMIGIALDILGNAKKLVGCRLVRLDCVDELVPYYQEKGFRRVTDNRAGSLNQMIAFVRGA